MKKFKARIIIRYAMVATIILLFAAFIVAEVFDTTVRHRKEWEHQTDSLLSIKSEIKPIRGDILACDGSVLATNVTYYTVRIDFRSEQLNDKEYAKSIGLMSEVQGAPLQKSLSYCDRHSFDYGIVSRWQRTGGRGNPF